MSAVRGARRVRDEEKPVNKDREFVVMTENRELIHPLLSCLTLASRQQDAAASGQKGRRVSGATDVGFYWFNLYLPRNVPESLRFKRRFYEPNLAKKALFYYWVINFKGFRTPAINQPDISFTSVGDVSARAPTTYLKPGFLFMKHD